MCLIIVVHSRERRNLDFGQTLRSSTWDLQLLVQQACFHFLSRCAPFCWDTSRTAMAPGLQLFAALSHTFCLQRKTEYWQSAAKPLGTQLEAAGSTSSTAWLANPPPASTGASEPRNRFKVNVMPYFLHYGWWYKSCMTQNKEFTIIPPIV